MYQCQHRDKASKQKFIFSYLMIKCILSKDNILAKKV